MKIRDWLGISEKSQKHLTRFMQIVLAGVMAVGLFVGDPKIIVNAGMGLTVSFLPALLENRYSLSLDSGLALWISSAVFLHAVGTVNLTGSNLYSSLWWWDHMTHSLSASVVAAAGYTTLRALDEHYEDLHFPRKMMFVFILIFILAFGVIWELIEFGISGLAEVLGAETILTQYGLEDSMKDLMFNTAGGMLAAFFGEIYLNDTVEQVREIILEKTEKRSPPV